jgi:hypothetical protein
MRAALDLDLQRTAAKSAKSSTDLETFPFLWVTPASTQTLFSGLNKIVRKKVVTNADGARRHHDRGASKMRAPRP